MRESYGSEPYGPRPLRRYSQKRELRVRYCSVMQAPLHIGCARQTDDSRGPRRQSSVAAEHHVALYLRILRPPSDSFREPRLLVVRGTILRVQPASDNVVARCEQAMAFTQTTKQRLRDAFQARLGRARADTNVRNLHEFESIVRQRANQFL